MEQNKNFQKFIDSKDFILKDGIAKKNRGFHFHKNKLKIHFHTFGTKKNYLIKRILIIIK